MSMHQGLDLSRFKKVSSDKKTTTLRHDKGHEIRIAHSGLTEKMREKLESLPTHDGKGYKSYADGTPDQPVSQNDQAPVTQAAPAPAQNPPPETAAPAPTTNPTGQYLAGNMTTGQYLGDQPAQPQVSSKQQIFDELNNDHAEFERDLALGKITPETYHSLFAKKDTLGKIGTLFGLLVSGAGSGLSGQPNAVMGMMQNEIANDLDAQKSSNTNAQNWYTLTQKHELQKAEIAKMAAESALIGAQTSAVPSQIAKTQAETGLTQAQAGAVPSQIAKTQADTGLTKAQTTAIPSQIARTQAETGLVKGQASAIPSQIAKTMAETGLTGAETGIKTNTLAANRATGAAWQSIVDMTDKMPEGPQKEQMKTALGMMYPQYQGLITDKNAQAAGMIDYARMINGAGATPGQDNQSAVDFGKMNTLQRMGQNKMPGGMTDADVANATKEAAELNSTRAMRKSYFNSFNKLDSMALAGELNPGVRAAEINALSAIMAKQSAGKYTEADANNLIKGMFPDVIDWGDTRKIKREKGQEFWDIEEKKVPTLQRFDLVRPLDKTGEIPEGTKKSKDGAPKASPSEIPEGTRSVTKDGKTKVIRRNNQWVPE